MIKKQINRPEKSPDSRSRLDHKKETSNTTDSETSDVENSSDADDQDNSKSLAALSIDREHFPTSVGVNFDVFRGTDDNAYLLPHGLANPTVLRLGSRQADAFLRRCAYERGTVLKSGDLHDVTDTLIAHAELSGVTRPISYRVASIDGGVEIDLGDEDHTRVRITAGKVETISEGSDVLFWRSSAMRALPMLPEKGDVKLLAKYANLNDMDQCLLIIWIAYILGNAKHATTSFLILLLLGPQGSGKSWLSRCIRSVIDPTSSDLRAFPRSTRDLAIAAAQAHLLVLDNVRAVPPRLADALCMTSTGGSFSTRRLYQDSDEVSLSLHVAVLMTSIHAVIDQSDLAERSLPLSCRSIDKNARRRESELMREFEADRPVIFRGIVDFIAAVLEQLPKIEPSRPERMATFSHWLAAAERVNGVPPGVYEDAYAAVLTFSMRDAMLEHPLAAAILALVDGDVGAQWTGTPTELLDTLSRSVNRQATYSHEWPRTPSALSKRLQSLETGLNRQGVQLEFGRGHQRRITITRTEVSVHE